jgi:hypothetical protein
MPAVQNSHQHGGQHVALDALRQEALGPSGELIRVSGQDVAHHAYDRSRARPRLLPSKARDDLVERLAVGALDPFDRREAFGLARASRIAEGQHDGRAFVVL